MSIFDAKRQDARGIDRYEDLNTMKKIVVGIIVFCIVLLSKPVGAAPAVQTKEVLQQIYHEKVSGFQFYSAYSEAADRGNEPVFSTLFETLADAELLQAAECLRLLEGYGESMPEPANPTIHADVVEKNLEKLLSMEELLINQRYSAWMKKLRAEHQQEPLNSVTRLWQADKQRYLLLQQMRAMSATHAYTKIKSFVLCQICGYVTFRLPKRFCPICYQNPSYFSLKAVESPDSGPLGAEEGLGTTDNDSFKTYSFE